MHEQALARAAVPEPVVCMRLRLRVLSLGHLLHLDRADLVREDGWLSPFDVPRAVLVCAQSWRENCRMTDDWFLSWKLAVWNWRSRKCDLLREKDIFEKYLRDGSESFKASDAPKDDRPFGSPGRLPGTPFLLRLQQWLTLHMRKTEEAAWDYPFGLAMMRWACFWEEEGAAHVYSEQDETFDKFVREQEAQRAARAAASAMNPS